MPEATAPEPGVLEPHNTAAAIDIVVENNIPGDSPDIDSVANGESNQKRAREENDKEGVSKKQKMDAEEEEKQQSSGPVNLGFKSFGSSLELFDYFYTFLHAWPPCLNVNKYEYKMLLELVKNGHQEPDKKIGGGIRAFQIRRHPMWKSKCFFLIREDESVDDFSFRKCVDHILPLPEVMQLKPHANKALGGKGGGGRGGGPGHGRKGKTRH